VKSATYNMGCVTGVPLLTSTLPHVYSLIMNQRSMKIKLLYVLATVATLPCVSKLNLTQAPNLGTAAGFVLFSSNGEVSNAGISQLTGNAGTALGGATGFGSINGVIHIGNDNSFQCSTDLPVASNLLAAVVPDSTPASLLGNDDTLLTDTLYLNAQGNEPAAFVIQISDFLSTRLYSKVILISGKQPKNVYRKVDGAINIERGTTLTARMLTTTRAVNTAMNVLATEIPVNCNSSDSIVINSSNNSKLANIYRNPFEHTAKLVYGDVSITNPSTLKM